MNKAKIKERKCGEGRKEGRKEERERGKVIDNGKKKLNMDGIEERKKNNNNKIIIIIRRRTGTKASR